MDGPAATAGIDCASTKANHVQENPASGTVISAEGLMILRKLEPRFFVLYIPEHVSILTPPLVFVQVSKYHGGCRGERLSRHVH